MTMFKSYNLKGVFTALVTFFSISSYACGYDFVGQCATEAKFSVNTAQTNYLNPDCTYGSPLTPNFGSNITELKLIAGKTFTWESCTNNVIQSVILYRIYQNPSNKGSFVNLALTQTEYNATNPPYKTRTYELTTATNLLTNLQSNTTYTFEMCYQIFVDSNGDGIVDESKLKDNGGLCYTSTFTTGTINIALPVELLNFQAQTQGKNALLTWQTASEKDNTGFKIERSVDAQKFENIGFVVGNGTTSEKQSYSFTDEGPLSIGGYYRLCQVDNDGNKAYSKAVYVANAQKSVLTLSPNPAYDRISLGLSDDVVDATVTVFDMMGRVLLQTKFTGFNADLDISGLISGTYCATVTTARESLKKIFVKR